MQMGCSMAVRGFRQYRGIAALSAAVGLTIVLAPMASALTSGLQAPPTPVAQTAATNALLQPADLTSTLTTGEASVPFSTGFRIPPSGLDPIPVCIFGPTYGTVMVPEDQTVGYSASAGFVLQDVYQYTSVAQASKAWANVDRQIATKCMGAWKSSDAGPAGSVSSRRLPAVLGVQGWSVTTRGSQNLQTAVYPVGDSIAMVTFLPNVATMSEAASKRAVINAAVVAAIDALAANLVTRWANRATAPLTQPVELTRAQATMLMPADLPATLPVTMPAEGGWSSLTADWPGDGPLTCDNQAVLPKGSVTFSSWLGGDGGAPILNAPGLASQQLDVYASKAEAQAAWVKVRAAVLSCDNPAPQHSASMKSVERSSSGESTLSFDGVPGVWSRYLSIEAQQNASETDYTLFLLVGNSIQSVEYITGREGAGQVKLDQLPVNQLAESLAKRWQKAQGTA